MPRAAFSLMLHGGAGVLAQIADPSSASHFRQAIRLILEQGRALLQGGASAVNAVETCVRLLEDDPLFNAGRGSVLNELGRVEMDAGIMDGRDLGAGAVAAVTNVANPIRLARLVMEEGGQVLLVGEGARRFAEQRGLPLVEDDYFLTAERVAELARVRGEPTTSPEAEASPGLPLDGGTVGAVARDRQGHLAAATSTGGRVNKRVGRVGDSPIIGAGVYADDETCAVSATGQGEDILRTTLAKAIAAAIDYRGAGAQVAVDEGMARLRQRIAGRAGVIVVDRDGRCGCGFTTERMIRGWIEREGEPRVHC